MIDITKEEFWDNSKFEEIEKKDSKLINTIKLHKGITALLIALSVLMISNVILIYKFFNILNQL